MEGKQEIKAIMEERKGEENREVEGCVFVGYVVLWLGVLFLVVVLVFVCVSVVLFLLLALMSGFCCSFCWLSVSVFCFSCCF